MVVKSLDDILGDFDNIKTEKCGERRPITVWVSEETKAQYDQIQVDSSKQFSKKIRELVIMAINKTSQKV